MPAPLVCHLARNHDHPAGRAAALELPALAMASSEVVYRGRNTLVRVSWLGRDTVVKCFPPGRGAIKASKALANAQRLQELGIGTPEPFAAVIGADGAGWFACAWIGGCRAVWDLHDRSQPDSDRHCADLGAFIGRMHQACVHHRDLTPGNVLLAPAPSGFTYLVIDHNRMSFGRIGFLRGVAALVQLECAGRTLGGYCAARAFPLGLARAWYTTVAVWHRLRWWVKDGTRAWRRRLAGRG
jgi:hypothetical protein